MTKLTKLDYIDFVLFIIVVIAAIVWFVSCTGCAAIPPQPKIVDVEVAVPCKTQPVPTPVWATSQLPATDNDIYDLSKAFAVERTQRIQYETLLLAANQACQ